MIHGTIAGNLGKDAELRHTQDGQAVCSFSVASSTKVKGEEVTTWVRCSMWGKRGESLSRYLVKGAKVTVVGSLSLREYEKGDEVFTNLECRVDDVALMGGKPAAESGGREERRAAPTRAPAEPDGGHGGADNDYGGEEIPF